MGKLEAEINSFNWSVLAVTEKMGIMVEINNKIITIRNNIRKKINIIFVLLTGKNYYYNKVIFRNVFWRIIKKKKRNKFLFILSPPNCGSTLLNQILSSSKSVSVNNKVGTREGQRLPIVKEIMYTDDRWDNTLKYDWLSIKKQWMRYWDISSSILLDKSPPNIIRASVINQFFIPAYFIILYRNPYAHCESLIRRSKFTPIKAAKFAIDCLKYQKKNIEILDNFIRLSYETLTEKPNHTVGRLAAFLPELSDINIQQEFTAHNFKNKKKLKIINLNDEKIDKLTPIQIREIHTIFRKEIDVITFFGYKLIPQNES